jgi:hypothetical protein
MFCSDVKASAALRRYPVQPDASHYLGPNVCPGRTLGSPGRVNSIRLLCSAFPLTIQVKSRMR